MFSSIQTKLLEALAVVFSLAYTWMYLKGELPEGYIFAGLGAGLFAFLCWTRKIYAESALQFFYIGMAVYGYNLVSEGGTAADQSRWRQRGEPCVVSVTPHVFVHANWDVTCDA